jgi:hypothetical protein
MIAITLLVRDERDVIRANLEYHLAQGVDLAIVTDNNSVDETPEIVREYERAGVARLIEEPADDYSQARWVTRMAHAAAQAGASWVIHCDADEFWWPAGADLRSTLAAVPDGIGVIRAARHDFAPRPDDGLPFWELMTLRDLDSRSARGRPLPPKVAHRAHPEAEVSMGNHRVSGPDLGDTLEPDGSPLEILHFPLRTYGQFENKIVKGGRALRANRELPNKSGRTWRRLLERWERGELPAYYESEVGAPLAHPERFVEDTRLRDFIRGLPAVVGGGHGTGSGATSSGSGERPGASSANSD